MCGILGVMATTPVNQLLYDGLMVLQHRGQDAAGIATAEGNTFHLHKGPGLVRDVDTPARTWGSSDAVRSGSARGIIDSTSIVSSRWPQPLWRSGW